MPVKMYTPNKIDTVWVEITKQTVAQGENVKVGDKIELTVSEARILIMSNKAKKIAAPVQKSEKVSDESASSETPEPEHKSKKKY